MRIELTQANVPYEMGRRNCAACSLAFDQGPVLARLLGDGHIPLDVGVVCPTCLDKGRKHIEEKVRMRAFWAREKAEEYERLAAEHVRDTPTLEEYEVVSRLFDGPRYSSEEEAEQHETGG